MIQRWPIQTGPPWIGRSPPAIRPAIGTSSRGGKLPGNCLDFLRFFCGPNPKPQTPKSKPWPNPDQTPKPQSLKPQSLKMSALIPRADILPLPFYAAFELHPCRLRWERRRIAETAECLGYRRALPARRSSELLRLKLWSRLLVLCLQLEIEHGLLTCTLRHAGVLHIRSPMTL